MSEQGQLSEPPDHAGVPSASRRVRTLEVEDVDSRSRTMAMLAHVLGLLTSLIGPLIILLAGKDDLFIQRQSREALNFQITVLIGLLVGGILTLLMIGVVVIIVVLVADIVFCIIAAAETNQGRPYRYPLTLRLLSAGS